MSQVLRPEKHVHQRYQRVQLQCHLGGRRRPDRRLDLRPHGRKRIDTWDLLLYVFGLLWIDFAVHTWMLVLGYVLAGLAVGIDVPASWTLIAEIAPARRRGRLGGLAQVMWYSGPVVVLALSIALEHALPVQPVRPAQPGRRRGA